MKAIDEQASPAGRTHVEKPWGFENRWAVTAHYLGKVLHINAGEALSLQFHRRKDESILVVRGRMDLDLEDGDGAIVRHRMLPGDTRHITPGRRHRMTAVEDCDVFEVSTPDPDDVVRLEDRYGRR
jgi:mannose-6-phosphate isomerase